MLKYNPATQKESLTMLKGGPANLNGTPAKLKEDLTILKVGPAKYK